MQGPNIKGQKDKQQSRKNTTQKTKYCTTRTPMKNVGDHRCSGRVGLSCFTSNTRLVVAKR